MNKFIHLLATYCITPKRFEDVCVACSLRETVVAEDNEYFVSYFRVCIFPLSCIFALLPTAYHSNQAQSPGGCLNILNAALIPSARSNTISLLLWSCVARLTSDKHLYKADTRTTPRSSRAKSSPKITLSNLNLHRSECTPP